MGRKTIVFILLCAKIGFAQIDTLSLSFYPLNTGNYWEYKADVTIWDFMYPPVTETYYYSVRVTGDTLLPNHETYKILKETRFDQDNGPLQKFYFQRIDTSTCNVYQNELAAPDQEYLIDSLKSLEGDTCKAAHDLSGGYRGSYARTICTEFTTSEIFADSRWTKYFKCEVLDGFQYILVRNIGLYSYQNSFDFGTADIVLQYAEVNGMTYGEKVNTVENRELRKPGPGIFLYQNYPNPFNSKTKIRYYLDKAEEIEINLYTINGEKVSTLSHRFESAGTHSLIIDGDALASGIYIYTLKTIKRMVAKKSLLVK